mgnify:CR=1 FL=1
MLVEIELRLEVPGAIGFKNHENLCGLGLTVDWNIPCLPNKEDQIFLDSILDKDLPDYMDEYPCSWWVDFVHFKKVNKQIVPVIYLQGS